MYENKLRLKTVGAKESDTLDQKVNDFLSTLETRQNPKLTYRHTNASLVCHIEYYKFS